MADVNSSPDETTSTVAKETSSNGANKADEANRKEEGKDPAAETGHSGPQQSTGSVVVQKGTAPAGDPIHDPGVKREIQHVNSRP
jgi:hypothetical protein